jgi:NTE family protein
MTWSLVLSGGVACGIANGGVLEALEEAHMKPDIIAGSSMGAIIAALYAYGIPIANIKDLTKELSPLSIVKLSSAPFQKGLHSGLLTQRIEEKLGPLLGNARIRDCKIPFLCVAGCVTKPVEWHRIINEGFTEYAATCIQQDTFDPEVRLIDAITASSAMPVIFAPARIADKEYVDLLNFGAIPSRTVRDAYHPDIIVGTNTNPDYGDLITFLPKGWQQFLQEGQKSLNESKAACDIVIEPNLPYGPLRFDKASDFWESGKRATEAMMPSVRSLLI